MTLRARLLLVALGYLAVAPGGSPAQDVPEQARAAGDAVATIEVDLALLRSTAGELAVAQFLKEPDVAALLSPLSGMVKARLAGFSDLLAQATGANEAEMRAIIDSRCALEVLPRSESDRPAAPFHLSFAVRTAGFSWEAAMPRIVKEAGERFGLESAVSWSPPVASVALGPDLRLHAMAKGETLWISTAAEHLGRTGAEGQDGGSRVERARARVGGDRAWLFAHLDFQRFLGLSMRYLPEETRDAMGLAGFDAFGGMGYGLAFEGEGVRERFWMQLTDRHGWMAGRAEGRSALRTPGLAPAESSFFVCDRIDPGASIAGVLQFLDEASPRQADQVRGYLADVEQALGLASVQELFRILGPEYALYAAFPKQGLIPDAGLILQIQDRKRVEALLHRVAEAGQALPGVRVHEFRGHRLCVFDPAASSEGGSIRMRLRPTLAIVGEHLVATAWPVSAKRLIEGLEAGSPRLENAAGYQRLLARLGGPAATDGTKSLTYIDTGRMMGFLFAHGGPLAQMLSTNGAGRFHAWPMQEDVDRHFFGTMMLGASSEENGSVSGESWGPLGVAPVYGLLGASFSAMALMAPAPVPAPVRVAGSGPAPGSPAWDAAGAARADLERLRLAIEDHFDWEGRFPAAEEWPSVLVEGSKNRRSAYLKDPPLVDPWGNPYLYEVRGPGRIVLRSLGADGKPGGEGAEADIEIAASR